MIHNEPKEQKMDQELIAYLDRRFDEQDRSIEDLKESNRHTQVAVEDLKQSHRHTQVMVEGLRSDVQLVAEGVAAVDQKLERYREEVHQRRDADQASVRAGFKALRRKDDELDRRLTRLETGGLPG